MRLIAPLISVISVLFASASFGQERSGNEINWGNEFAVIELEDGTVSVPTCHGCINSIEKGGLPIYLGKETLGKGSGASQVSLRVLELGESLSMARPDSPIGAESLKWARKDERGTGVVVFEFVPIVESAGNYYRVEKFELNITKGPNVSRAKNGTFKSTSVLATGEWYKIGVVDDGVYRISADDLAQLGIDVENLNPRSLNVFGNGIGQLPYENDIERPDDLIQNDIYIEGESDESFDEDDFILFYGKGPHQWTYNENDDLFDHHKHEFVDTSYYFIGINTGHLASRIGNVISSGQSPNRQVDSFDDYAFHEVDRENMIKSGRVWYGEKFDVQTTRTFSGDKFTFPNLVQGEDLTIRAELLSRTTVTGSCKFELSSNGVSDFELFSRVGTNVTSDFGVSKELEIVAPNGNPNVFTTISYEKNAPSASGWLNWLNVNVRRDLEMSGSQMIFRDIRSVGDGNVSKFNISNASGINEVWDVTQPTTPKRINGILEGGILSFTFPTDELKEFVAFSGGYKSVRLFGPVGNQNLHGLGQDGVVDMVIVAPTIFMDKAEELADIHRNYDPDPLNVEVVDVNHIYNEFSSGMRDVTAIKWFMKMFYDRANGQEPDMPSYLLLFGDGSFDNRNFTAGNTNLIPTFQSLNSLEPANSFVSDDYFGFLSDDEGQGNLDVMDIGVGRIVAKNIQEATSVVNKIRRYVEINEQTFDDNCTVCGNNASNFGAWRNAIALVADDEDTNSHMSNSRTIGNQINGYTSDYNIERIFTDAFQQIATPGGERYPDVNAAIDRRVRNGAFIINYIGHGGELGWAQERILDIPTILDWNNSTQLPVFMTATCEFTRFDDPLRTSAGEMVLLNGNGGGIALLTTTRLVYSAPNFTLNQRFYDALFNRPDGEVVTRLGDVSRECKNSSLSASSSNHRNFSLIGDPALPMAIPKYRAEISAITDTLGAPIDTLKALGVARVTGEIRDQFGNVLPDFNGRLNATVFDRIEEKTTLANDGGNPFTYPTQENVVYRGNAEVTNGQFEFDFVIPKDISFATDTTARISLYAVGLTEDATGFANELVIGGRDENAVDDGQGPDVSLYLNDENFVFGGYTNGTPVLIAEVFDPNGINTVGSGVGHDISAVLDGDTQNSIVLNDYYESDLNTYRSGRVQYQFDELEPGNHTLKLKVWDVHNNSSEAEIEFIVAESDEFAIERVLNYPNPFTTNTSFFFEHNQSCDFLNVLIQVYTVSGKLVKSINTVSNTDGFRNEAIKWDGKDDYGDKLATGVYVYKLSVRNPSGEQVEKFEKLVILN